VLSTPTPQKVEKIALVYPGRSGKGMALRAIMEVAKALNVRACVTVDSDLRSITPEWIHLLAGPVVDRGYDYVTPYYTRHKYDATITNNITFPMTRMLYGLEVRQPIGGDFGFTGEFAKRCLAKDVWDTDVGAFGIDIWLTTTAINEGFKVCQARLGAKSHDPKDPATALGPMFVQVVGTMFSMMSLYEQDWTGQTGIAAAPIFGAPRHEEPEPVEVTVRLMIERFRAGWEQEAATWEAILAPDTLVALNEIVPSIDEAFDFPARTWAKSVIDFAVAYNKASRSRNETVLSMTPLYYGRAASMAMEMAQMNSEQAEETVLGQARVFEELKPYLIERWRAAG
jgi:hypothetical protein